MEKFFRITKVKKSKPTMSVCHRLKAADLPKREWRQGLQIRAADA